MTATALDLSAIRTDATTYAGTFRTLIGVYSSSQVDAIIAGLTALEAEDIDTLAEINAILTDANLASIAYVDGLADNYATAAQGALAATALQPTDITSGTITAGTGDIDFDALGGGLENFAESIATTSPNNIVNVASFTAQGDTTNVGVAIVPKGSGAFSLAVPDGTAAGGHARGANAVDLQTSRMAANQVASGSNSFTAGIGNRASGAPSFAAGFLSVASGNGAVALGRCTASGAFAFASGEYTTASGEIASAFGFANAATMPRSFAHGEYAFSRRGNEYVHGWRNSTSHGLLGQFVRFSGSNVTTDNTATELLNFNQIRSDRLFVPSGFVCFYAVSILGVKSDGTAVAIYKRKVSIKNVGGTTSLVGPVETIGTDHEDNAATDVSITADDTNDALNISVTGIAAETWRWLAVIEGVELAYGT